MTTWFKPLPLACGAPYYNKHGGPAIFTTWLLSFGYYLRVLLLRTDTMIKATLITFNRAWLSCSEVQSSIIKAAAW